MVKWNGSSMILLGYIIIENFPSKIIDDIDDSLVSHLESLSLSLGDLSMSQIYNLFNIALLEEKLYFSMDLSWELSSGFESMGGKEKRNEPTIVA
jgi:hypothetical protein